MKKVQKLGYSKKNIAKSSHRYVLRPGQVVVNTLSSKDESDKWAMMLT